MIRLLVIANAGAGSSDDAVLDAALEVLRQGADVEVAATGGPEELAGVLAARDGREIVVAGGDGSIHAVMRALHEAGEVPDDEALPIVSLLPLGTGNDLARALDLPLEDPREAAAIILRNEPRRTDLITDSDGGVVVNAAHVGVGAEAGERAIPWKERLCKVKLGRLGYPIGAVSAMVGTRGWRLNVEADGRELAHGRERLLQVAVTNGSSVGGGAEIAPDADAASGSMEVVISRTLRLTSRLHYGWKLRRGLHVELPDVETTRAKSVTVTSLGRPFPVNSDGEMSDPVRSRTWTVHPGAFAMRVPPHSP